MYGYRTYMSMLNKDTWEYAHKVCGTMWRNVGLILLIITLIIGVILRIPVEKAGVCLIIIDLVAMIGTLPIVEYKLKKKFDNYGKRK
nr:SdpI family protein [Clostridium botulinum]